MTGGRTQFVEHSVAKQYTKRQVIHVLDLGKLEIERYGPATLRIHASWKFSMSGLEMQQMKFKL